MISTGVSDPKIIVMRFRLPYFITFYPKRIIFDNDNQMYFVFVDSESIIYQIGFPSLLEAKVANNMFETLVTIKSPINPSEEFDVKLD